MAVNYDKLFHMLIDKKISNAQLAEKAGVSANIITRLKRDQYVAMESIEKICHALNNLCWPVLNNVTVTESALNLNL